MLRLDEIPAAGALAEMVRRAVREKRVELLHDAETDSTAALVPSELMLRLMDAGDPSMATLRERLQAIVSREREAKKTVQSPLPPNNEEPDADPDNAASIALLQSWLEEDATDDPQEIRQAEEELEQFKQGINAERDRAGARRIYP